MQSQKMKMIFQSIGSHLNKKKVSVLDLWLSFRKKGWELRYLLNEKASDLWQISNYRKKRQKCIFQIQNLFEEFARSDLSFHHDRFQLLTKSDGSIRVGSISPGLVRTEIVKAAFPDQPGFSDQIYSTFPCLEAEDLADLIDYLLSNPKVFQRTNSFFIKGGVWKT